MIAIVNPRNDLHGQYMAEKLRSRQAEYIVLESPETNDYALYEGVLYYNGKPLENVTGVYFRSITNMKPTVLRDAGRHYNEQVRHMACLESVNAWLSILHEQGNLVMNPPSKQSKYYQLYTLKHQGIRSPRTLITSSPALARAFVREVGQAVCKPLAGGSFCIRVTEDVLQRFECSLNEPAIFQEEVAGQDVRVNMLDGRVLSAHVILKKDSSILDYRTDPDYSSGQASYAPVTLPESTVTACDLAMKQLGLRFSGIDLRMTPEGEFVLLECNSMPAFLDIEVKTGAPITDQIIDAMMAADKGQLHAAISEQLQKLHGDEADIAQDRSIDFFDYYQVAKEYWLTEQTHDGRTIIKLNDAQRKQLLEETGELKEYAQLERKAGELQIVGLW